MISASESPAGAFSTEFARMLRERPPAGDHVEHSRKKGINIVDEKEIFARV
jgi:hypothetical protein